MHNLTMWNFSGEKLWEVNSDSIMLHPVLSPNDSLIIVNSEDKSYLYDNEGKLIDYLPEMTHKYFFFTRDSKHIIIPNEDNTIIYNVKEKKSRTISQSFLTASTDQTKLLFHIDNYLNVYNHKLQLTGKIAIDSTDNFMCKFSARGDKIIYLSRESMKLFGVDGTTYFHTPLTEHVGDYVYFADDDSSFLTYGLADNIYLWGMDGELLKRIPVYRSVRFAKFINDNTEILSITDNNFINVPILVILHSILRIQFPAESKRIISLLSVEINILSKSGDWSQYIVFPSG